MYLSRRDSEALAGLRQGCRLNGANGMSDIEGKAVRENGD
jgi:hypothetical protein